MKAVLSVLFSFGTVLSPAVGLAVDFPPPSGCAQGCDQTVGYPTSACYQCPSGAAELLQCRYDGSATVPGHLCEKQLEDYGYPYSCMCSGTCAGCTSAQYSNSIDLSASVVPKSGGFTIVATVPFQAPCHWCQTNPWGCAAGGMCVIQDYTGAKNCSNARVADIFCEPRFEQGTWYPVFGVACSAAGTTLNYSARMERCTGTSGCSSSLTSGSVGVPIPLPLESGCTASPDWECCNEGGGSVCVGGPINVSSGNMHYDESDFTLDDIAGFTFTRAYNNQEKVLATTGGWMGYGWTHTFNQRLTLTNTLSDTRRIYRHVNAEGRKRYYLEDAPSANTFTAYWPYDQQGTMMDDGSTLTIADLNGNTTRFTKSSGLWDRSCDFYGNCYTGAYTGGRLTGVTDPLNRTIALSYNASNRVNQITLWDGTTAWRFFYDGTNNYLTQVFFPGNGTANPDRLYVYDSASPKNLLQAKNRAGQILEAHTYDSSRRATSSYKEGNQEWLQISYPSNVSTIVTEHQNDTTNIITTYDWRYQGGRGLVTQIQGSCGGGCGFQDASFLYDEHNRTTQITDANSNITKKQYDTTGRLTTLTEAFGTALEKTTNYFYENTELPGMITKIQYPSVVKTGETKTIEYDLSTPSHTIFTTTTTGWLYDTDVTPTVHTETTTYDSAHRPIQHDGPRTDVADLTTWQYHPDGDSNLNLRGRLYRITNARGHIRQFENYDVFGTALLTTDPNGVQTQRTTDALGRVTVESILPHGIETETITTQTFFDDNGRLDYLIQPEGNVVNYTFDAAGRLTEYELEASMGAHGDKSVYTWDKHGNKTKEEYYQWQGGSYTQDKITEYAFDDHNRLWKTINPDATYTEYFYDPAGNLQYLDDANHPYTSGDHYTTHVYNALNRLQSTTVLDGAIPVTTQFGYDSHGNLTQVTDPEGHATTYTFDDFGDLRRTVSPDSGTTDRTYDPAGNTLTETDALSATTTRTYDALNRLSTIVYPIGSYNVTLTYDELATSYGIGRLTMVADSAGTTTFNYFKTGREKNETITISATPYTTAYTFDKNGNQTTLTHPDGRQVAYTVNTVIGKVSAISAVVNGSSQPLLSGMGYYPFGPQSAGTFGNGLSLARAFDLKYRPSSNANGPISTTYTHDDEFNITAISGSYSRSYGYDDLYRLTSASGLWGSMGYSYDRNGNRLTKTENADSTSYNYQSGTNRLTSTTGHEPESFTFNADGSITADSLHVYGYGSHGHMVNVDSGATASYFYDYQMRRREAVYPSKTVLFFYGLEGQLIAEKDLSSGFWTDYIYNRTEPVAQVVNQPPWMTIGSYLKADKTGGYVHLDWTLYGGNENFRVYRSTNDFTFSSPSMIQELTPKIYDDNVLGNSNNYAYKIFKGVPTDAVYYYHTDHLMTPLAMTDSSQASVWEGVYYPFGRLYGESGTVTNLLRFPGQVADAAVDNASLYYNGHRWYGSRLGRYSTSDPAGLIEGGLNPFAYSILNPISNFDFLGLSAKVCCRRVASTVAGDIFRKRHCYIVANSNTTYGLYPQKRGENSSTIGIPRTDDPRDQGGICKDCPRDCSAGDQDRCIKDASDNYPRGEYRLLGPNSNTYAGTVARACCKGGVPEGLGSAPGIDDNPPQPAPPTKPPKK